MATSNPTVTRKSCGVKQTSVQPKTAAAVPQRMDIQMVQNVLLIWLDSNIDESSADCRNTIAQLRRVVHTINKYTDGKECVEFMKSIENEKACMIMSGSLGQQIVPEVHDMSQVDSIFIFCNNKTFHKQWAKEWPKIKGVYTDIARICQALEKSAEQCEQDSISISVVAISNDTSKTNLDQLEPSFMYTQILKEILLSINFEQKHINEFIEHCRNALADNESELQNVQKFERHYREKTPIWWYTYNCFLYPMLNRALRLMNTDIIVKMGFFIGDLHRHIEQLHQEQFTSHHSGQSFTVYRGQGLSKKNFEQLSNTRGGLLSFNNFLSTSKRRHVALNFAESALANAKMVGVLFVMKIDPAESSTPFADITRASNYGRREDEVLFSMHTVFRIGKTTPMREDSRLFEVQLILTSDNDKDLWALTDRIREDTFPDSTGWFRLGLVLKNMGQFDMAQQVYEMLLEQTKNDSEKGCIYDQLGQTFQHNGDYQTAITFYEKSLEVFKKTLSRTDPNLAVSYNNVGNVYYNMGDYPNALSCHEKALTIRQQSLSSNDPDLASSYSNLGMVYDSMSDYQKALASHEKAVVIRERSLPPTHPDLASSYNNIGMVYDSMGDYRKALSSHEKALVIRQQSLPPNHPDLASSYNNTGNVYFNMGDYRKALSYYEKDLKISEQSLLLNHPSLAISYNNIGKVYDSMGDYAKALSWHEKALSIRQKSLRLNHPDLADSHNNIGMVYDNMGEHQIALLCHEEALAIRQQSLPSNHPNLATSYDNIGSVYENTNDYSKARSFYERAVDIAGQSLPPNHPHLQKYKNNFERVKKKL